jgi:hypothetical protein
MSSTKGGEYMRQVKTVIGLFSDDVDAESAIGALKRRGYDPKDISLIMRDNQRAENIEENTGVGEGAASGAATGAVVGGIAGLLIGVGAFTIPGIGAVLIGGPLAAALGLSGAAATTASGAMTGALAGGLIGALMNLGLPRDEAAHYEQQIQAGAILLAVPAMEGQEVEAEEVMKQYNATDVKALTIDTDSAVNRDRRDEEIHTSRAHAGHR